MQRTQVLGGVAAALRAELDGALAAEGVPAWARERVLERTLWLGPVAHGKPPAPGPADARRRVSGQGTGSGAAGAEGLGWEVAGELVAAVDGAGIDEVARRLQEFWDELEEEVGKRWEEDVAVKEKGGRWRRRGGRGSGSEGEVEEREAEKEAPPSETGEKSSNDEDEQSNPKTIHVQRVMEAVEKAVCSLFYDR